MSEFNMVFSRWANTSREYNIYRLAPPDTLIKFLCTLSKKKPPETLVDLGCGTGLSTFPWEPYCKNIFGIDPSNEMLKIARENNQSPSVKFVNRYSNSTGLNSDSVDIIACTHSIHWMEPESTTNEIVRILKKDGMLVIMGHNFPPVSEHLVVDKRYYMFKNKCEQYTASLKLNEDFYKNMVEFSELLISKDIFNIYREFHFSEQIKWSAKEYIGWLYTHGVVQKLLQRNIDEVDFGLTSLKEKVKECFGNQQCLVMPVWKTIVFKNIKNKL